MGVTSAEAEPADAASTSGRDALVDRLFQAVLATIDAQSVYLGDRLGYYRALVGNDGLTSMQLAERTGTAERYAREWLEQQAVTGLVQASAEPHAGRRRYALPLAHQEPLTDELSPNFLVPLARMLVGLGKSMEALLEAYRSGGGVSWAQHGRDAREAQAAANRPMFLGALGRSYLPSVPAIDASLRAGGRVADIGCGLGWSSIGIAMSYPDATVEGFDVDAPSIEAARRNASAAGVSERVRFHHTDAATAVASDGVSEHFDLVAAFECIHDLPDPVSVLASMRALAGSHGVVLVMDERVAAEFTAPGEEVERLMYGYSLMCCLPDAMAHQPSAATGTVLRPDTLREYALAAGYQGIDVLDISDDFFRFYLLRHD